MRVIGLAGWSGAGKTTTIVGLIPCLVRRGFSISTVKHAHHDFDVDQPGKDSYAHRAAGAREVLVASSKRFALMHEVRGEAESSLADLLARMSAVDFVIVEGYKRDAHVKIELHRMANAKPFIYPDDPQIAALVSDGPPAAGLPYARLGDVEAIADLVERFAAPAAQTIARPKGAQG